MASYNGINYISEQLDSLRTQTLPPDEVIIFDDHSTDGTFELCCSYIERYGLKNWHTFRNTRNLDVALNFRAALTKCTGDYVFTCDQDDIWLPDKISSMVQVMQARPEISLLTSNYIPLVNNKPAKVQMKYIDRDDGQVIPLRLRDSGLSNLRPGCTFCFRRKLLDKFSVMDIDDALHDAMLWKYAITSDSLYLLNRKLIYWRRHARAATGAAFSSYINIDQRINETFRTQDMYRQFIEYSAELGIPPKNVKLLNDMTDFQQKRRNMLTKRSAFSAALFVVLNFKHYPTFRNALSDIYAMLFLK
ncbi:MAG: glycosyltransferase [Synergistaceae bacterium]|nr:glycosyltransferase [Synergistaceae bacterium]